MPLRPKRSNTPSSVVVSAAAEEERTSSNNNTSGGDGVVGVGRVVGRRRSTVKTPATKSTKTTISSSSISSSSSSSSSANVNTSGGVVGVGGGGGRLRPATSSSATATITTEDGNSTTTTNTNGNVNNNARVGVAAAGGDVDGVGLRSTTREIRPEQQLDSGGVVIVSGSAAQQTSNNNKSLRSGSVGGDEGSLGLTADKSKEVDSPDDGGGGGDGGGAREKLSVKKSINNLSSSDGDEESSPVSDEDDRSSKHEEPAGCQSFYIIVNPDGSLSLDNSKQAVLGPGQERFPVNLPKNKVRTANPLPGAVPISGTRTRKSKPEGVTYGGSSDVGFITSSLASGGASQQIPIVSSSGSVGVNNSGSSSGEADMSVGINQSPVIAQTGSHVVPGGVSSSGPIDMDEFNELDPQSFAALEKIFQSEQGREIVENLELDPAVTVTSAPAVPLVAPAPVVETPEGKPTPEGGSTGWDHSYTNNETGRINREGEGESSASSVAGSNVGGVMSPESSAANSPAGPRTGGKGGRAGGRSRPSTVRISEGDSGNIRRSQRQQDRIERQEAERILAENQQMLQREKEIMKEKEVHAQTVSSSPTTSSPAAISPAAKVVTATITEISVLPPQAAPPPHSPSPRESVDSVGSEKRPYPKRENRKLPAHLADPNYVNLDEDGVKVDSVKPTEQRRSSVHSKSASADESAGSGNESAGDDEDYTEDDPNRLWCICQQPHNNRFMICCDTCEEWFHGKCVNVTKAQGKAMELKNMTWVCPPCRKNATEKHKREAAEARNNSRRRSETVQVPAPISPSKSRTASNPKSGTASNPKSGTASNPKSGTASNPKSGTTSNPKPSTSAGRLSKSAVAQQAEAAAAANAAKSAATPAKIAAQSPISTKRLNVRRSDSHTDKDKTQDVIGCVICGKPTRKDSAYCSDTCVTKFSDNVKSDAAEKDKPGTPPSTPTSAQSKLKRSNSVKGDGKPVEPIFAFHVITPGSSKSTEIVPPKPKELTASQLLKAQREASTGHPASPTKSSPTTVSSTTGSQGGTAAAAGKKPVPADGKSSAKLSTKASKDPPASDDKDKRAKDKEKEISANRPRTRTTSESRNKSNTSTRQSERDVPKKDKDSHRDRDGQANEKLHKENMKKGLRELLKTRMKEMSEEEQAKINESSNTPEALAEKIADELCRSLGGASNPKCKAKYRSIYFNLKDSKNCIYQEILHGNLKPKALVKMEPHELASAELAEWRKKESQKELEAIKKAEVDKYAEAKKIEMLEKGYDVSKAAEETRSLDISDIIETNEKIPNAAAEGEESVDKTKVASTEKDRHKSSSSRNHSRHDKDKRSSSSGLTESKSKDKHSSERRRSERHKDRETSTSTKETKDRHSSTTSSKDRDKEQPSSSTKVKHSDRKSISEKDKKDRFLKSKESSSKNKDSTPSPIETIENRKQEEVSSNSSSPEETVSSDLPPQIDTKEEESLRHSTDSEQEMPSSTIKTPDYSDEAVQAKKDADSKYLFQTKIVMPELGGFNASAHAVSHFATEGIIFPESPVPIVGRIAPETVWDYINKMKKSKEVIVLRLSPATPADSEGYMTFFSYFSSRGRLGVIGGLMQPLKDVYLIPLDKHVPVNRSLLPFRGPGLPKERTHCLLCVVTRHIQSDIPVGLGSGLKRKAIVSEQNNKKKVKFGAEKKAKSSLPSKSTVPSDLPIPKPREENQEDDDTPYTPWEEEEDEGKDIDLKSTSEASASTEIIPDVVPNVPAPLSTDVQRQLQELEAKIAKETQDIEKITGALAGRSSTSGIPGLDGEFPEDESALEENTSTSIFLQPESSDKPMNSALPSSSSSIPEVFSRDVDDRKSLVSASMEGVTHGEDIELLDASAKNQKKTMSPNITGEDSEEAYSPSGMQFSDEETAGMESSKSSSETNASITKDESRHLQDPIVSAEAKQDDRHSAISIKPPLTEPDPIKIVMKKPNQLAVVNSSVPVTSATISDDVFDLVDDLEPPPPGETVTSRSPSASVANVAMKSLPPLSKKTSALNDDDESGVFAPKTSTLQTSASKSSLGFKSMKININLTTKQLPSDEKKAEPSAPAASVPVDTTKAITVPNPLSAKPSFSFGNPQNPPISIPVHLPPPTLQSIPPMGLLHNPPKIQVPPPSLMQSHPMIPVHIPPPALTSSNSTVPSSSSVVINLNIPPPPLAQIRGASLQPIGQGQAINFPPRPPGYPNTVPTFPNMIPGVNSMRPNFPLFNNANDSGNSAPGSADVSDDLSSRRAMESSDAASEGDRVTRVNLDRDSGRRETRGRNNNQGGRDFRGRTTGYGRRTFDRRRVRSRSRSSDRNRSRSRSRSRSRDRRHRRRQSKSRSKSPLSRRWEARNRSRSRSAGRRTRRRSRSRSPTPPRRFRDRVARSPRRNARRSKSKSKSPSTPSKSSKAIEENSPAPVADDDWEAPSPLRVAGEKALEKETKVDD